MRIFALSDVSSYQISQIYQRYLLLPVITISYVLSIRDALPVILLQCNCDCITVFSVRNRFEVHVLWLIRLMLQHVVLV